jgi:aspartate carbamoyltransferase regulatory subunit
MNNINNTKVRKYTFVGSYPQWVCLGHKCLCPDCANQSGDPIPDSAVQVNWENPDLYCDECEGRIESAYAEPA